MKQKKKIITSYEDGFKLAKEYKLMNTFRRILLILRNEIQQPNKERGNATVQETFNYLIQAPIIGNTEREFISWLKSWKAYVMFNTIYTQDVQRRLKYAYT
jgi:hypothetical protein